MGTGGKAWMALAVLVGWSCSSGNGTGTDAGLDIIGDGAVTDAPGTDATGDSDVGGEVATWGTCPDDPLATTETLAQKATEYDRIARTLHIHPELKWMAEVWLPTVECEGGGTCLAVSLKDATWKDVEKWDTDSNDGAWSGVYLASQAYRYGATGDEEALQNIRLLLEGLKARTEITGVPGNFVRQYIPLGVEGIQCPEGLSSYVPDAAKDSNKWVRVGNDGCLQVVGGDPMEWTTTEHCVPEAYAGWCFKDNVSRDEYAGHMLALAAIWQFVDDPDIRLQAAGFITDVGVHLMENDLNFVDWDGRPTQHGGMHPLSFVGTPGFLAVEVMAWVKLAAEVSGREDLRLFYEDCLLQRSGANECLPVSGQPLQPFTEYFPLTFLYLGPGGCQTNFNNVTMIISAYQVLLLAEEDPEMRQLVREALRDEVILADNRIAAIHHANPWYSFLWAAFKPDPDEPAFQAVEEAVCSLRQFPPTQQIFDIDIESLFPHYCTGRLDNSLAEHPIPVAHRCPREILFWRNPYERNTCAADPAFVRQPGDYLLPYWMGRYYGFIRPQL